MASDQPGAWVTENRTLDPDGDHVKYLPAWAEACAPAPQADPVIVEACFTGSPTRATGSRSSTTRPPTSGRCSGVETGLLLGLAALLTGFCFWRIRRDLT